MSKMGATVSIAPFEAVEHFAGRFSKIPKLPQFEILRNCGKHQIVMTEVLTPSPLLSRRFGDRDRPRHQILP